VLVKSWPRLVTTVTVSFALVAGVATASAQVQPQPTPQPQPLPQPTGPTPIEDKPEGVAEKAPKDPAALPTTPVLPPPKTRRKKFQFLELDGYFRFRTDWFKNFHLGFDDDPTLGGAPFREPLSCTPTAGVAKSCEETLKAANMRLRLEPVISIDEGTRVHFQVDVLDNLVLGSTPDGTFLDGTPAPTNIPISGFSGSQVPPEAGRNSVQDSIVVKRAWAEVMTPLGLLKFGRQPSHWGMGLLANGGGFDPFHGTYDLDADYGDTADRLMFGSMIPGTQFRIAAAMDWSSTRPTAAQTDIWSNRYDGQPWDLEDDDDVNQWVFVLARLDTPSEFQDTLDRGEIAMNYGSYFVYRTQEWDYNPSGLVVGGSPADDAFVPRDAKAYIPDVWFRVGHKKLELEFEGVAIIGNIEHLDDVGINDELDIRQYGAVGQLRYKMMEDRLKLGLEVGYASGDQWDNSPQGSTNVRDARALPGPGDTTVNSFRFDFDYKVDLILFRELLGTVTNATYFKPKASYDITKSIRMTLQSIVSFANVPVATPGNGSMYGVEFDADVGYENEGFFAGISYGVLFPLSAMDHPFDDPDGGGPGFGYGTNAGDAETAQTIQTRLMLKF
jgi:uncharacterized protein (TIGR04551 family)